jgi:hypothetical protein
VFRIWPAGVLLVVVLILTFGKTENERARFFRKELQVGTLCVVLSVSGFGHLQHFCNALFSWA